MGTQRDRGRRWLRFAVLPALAVMTAAGCASAGGPSVGPAARSSSQSTPGTTTTQVAQPRGPLASVGKGWTLAEYSASTSFDSTPSKAGGTTLYLVSPQGTRQTLYHWAAAKESGWRLIDWSGDKARALFAGQSPSSVGQLVLATGKFTTFTLPAGTQAISYSRPDGTAILATQQASSGDKILRYDLSGKLEKTLASGPQNAANVAVYSPDGTALAVNGAKGVEEVTNSSGAVRSLPSPSGATCQPVRWWNASTILASCLARGYTAPRLWLVPASGARPTALTRQRTGKGPDLGDIDAWQLPSGLYLQALSGCGVVYVAKQASDGSATTVNVPQTTGNDNQVITANGGKLLVRAQTSCDESTSLLWFTPATSAVQMLIRAPAGIQGVIAAVPYRPAGM
jgi:TolB protein